MTGAEFKAWVDSLNTDGRYEVTRMMADYVFTEAKNDQMTVSQVRDEIRELFRNVHGV
jgi:hypothetical protein